MDKLNKAYEAIELLETLGLLAISYRTNKMSMKDMVSDRNGFQLLNLFKHTQAPMLNMNKSNALTGNIILVCK